MSSNQKTWNQLCTDVLADIQKPVHCNVEFALQSQHETSSDSGIHLTSDINDLQNKSRKRPRSLSLPTMNHCDLDEDWETIVLQKNALYPKRIKLEQCED